MQRTILLALLLSQQLLRAQPLFDHQVIDANISIGYGLAIGDVDGDKKPDILLADKKQFAWYRNPDWQKFVLAENLTTSDNVCIAARDIDGDGKVEIAVGAQWNPGETSDTLKSGSVHFLVRPADATQKWQAIRLHHEPTVHRMKWVLAGPGDYRLVVVPLHGRGNANGAGAGVKVIAYKPPSKAGGAWSTEVIDQSMHLTHNFDILPFGNNEMIAIGGKEGVKVFTRESKGWNLVSHSVDAYGVGELRYTNNKFMAAIEPMHGTKVTSYFMGARQVLDSSLNQGHALVYADVLGTGRSQIIAGWREPDSKGKTGIRIYIPNNESSPTWKTEWIDEGGIACEDLVAADLNGDSRPDLVAAGRASKNLKIYWNKRK